MNERALAMDFPALQQQVATLRNAPPVAYLDNAATTQKPAVVLRAVQSFGTVVL